MKKSPEKKILKKRKAAKGEGHATPLSKHPLSPDSRKSPWVLQLETEGQASKKKPKKTQNETPNSEINFNNHAPRRQKPGHEGPRRSRGSLVYVE